MAEVKTPVLETKHLGISFGGLHAVQDFNIQMNAGELVGLIGPNGAGMTGTCCGRRRRSAASTSGSSAPPTSASD